MEEIIIRVVENNGAVTYAIALPENIEPLKLHRMLLVAIAEVTKDCLLMVGMGQI